MNPPENGWKWWDLRWSLPPGWELSIAEQQQVEIAKALSLNAKILIFDEPTSSLTNRETEITFWHHK